jgi:hypothetical protein
MREPNPKIDRDAPAWRIVSLWGTNSAFARAIGRTPSTTQRWLEKGAIDPEFHEEIIAAAKRDRKPLKADMFVDKRLFASTPPAPPIEEARVA